MNSKTYKPYKVDPSNWREILAGYILDWDRAEVDQDKAYDAIPEYVEKLLAKSHNEAVEKCIEVAENTVEGFMAREDLKKALDSLKSL